MQKTFKDIHHQQNGKSEHPKKERGYENDKYVTILQKIRHQMLEKHVG